MNNQGLQILTLINQRLRAEPLSPIEVNLLQDYTPQEIALFTYAPITSVQVERAFSLYKNILTDRRRSFTFENLKIFLLSIGITLQLNKLLMNLLLIIKI